MSESKKYGNLNPESTPNIDSYTHVRGESVYLDDIPMVSGTLFAAVFDSPIAHGKIKRLDLEEALNMKEVVRIFTAKDVPGVNQIGGIIPDEELLAEHHVYFCGMPIALVVAISEEAAKAALKKNQNRNRAAASNYRSKRSKRKRRTDHSSPHIQFGRY
jgi:xanthine dehydrogenase molybdopterin-binding subunit B